LGVSVIHLIDRTDVVSGGGVVTILLSSYRDTAWENDIDREKRVMTGRDSRPV
jgi:hypothetical protein